MLELMPPTPGRKFAPPENMGRSRSTSPIVPEDGQEVTSNLDAVTRGSLSRPTTSTVMITPNRVNW